MRVHGYILYSSWVPRGHSEFATFWSARRQLQVAGDNEGVVVATQQLATLSHVARKLKIMYACYPDLVVGLVACGTSTCAAATLCLTWVGKKKFSSLLLLNNSILILLPHFFHALNLLLIELKVKTFEPVLLLLVEARWQPIGSAGCGGKKSENAGWETTLGVQKEKLKMFN